MWNRILTDLNLGRTWQYCELRGARRGRCYEYLVPDTEALRWK